MFIVITGLDGSGTSTIAKKLHQMDDTSILLRTPPLEYGNREFIDSTVRNLSQYAHYLYYLSSNVYISDYIRKHIDVKHINVYCVRYLIDTVVSHRVAGINVALDYETYNMLVPDLTLFIQAKECVRQERISSRGKSLLDKILDDENVRNRFLKEFANLLDRYVIVDNTEDNVDEVVQNIFEQHIRLTKTGD